MERGRGERETEGKREQEREKKRDRDREREREGEGAQWPVVSVELHGPVMLPLVPWLESAVHTC